MRLVTLHAVRPNEGIVRAYQRAIEDLIDRMHREVDAEIHNAWLERPPLMASDQVTPSASAADVIRKLRRKWERELNGLAPELAKHFARASQTRSDAQLRAALRKAGFGIDFRLTREISDILSAATAENVALIKSIPAQYFTQVEGSVMRAMQTGRDLHTLSAELQGLYGVSRRRAVNIARDQGNKATSVINRARQLEVGITEAKWLHSAGGAHPRPSHVRQSGKLYDVRDGWYDPDAKERVWPGTLINCRCVSVAVLPSAIEARVVPVAA